MSIARMIAGAGLAGAWDISKASYSRSFSVSAQTANPTGVFFRPDGTEMFVSGGDDVFKYALSSSWDVTSASYSSARAISSTAIQDLSFKPDGTRMYVLDSVADDIEEYTLPTPWSFTSSSFSARRTLNDVGATFATPRGLFFKPDGTKFYVGGDSRINEYSMSTPWGIASATYVQYISTLSGQADKVQSVFFNTYGSRMYISGGDDISANGTDLDEYTLSTPWDISSAVYRQSLAFAAGRNNVRGVFFRQDGKRFYGAHFGIGTIDEYSLTGSARTAFYGAAGSYSFVVPSGITAVSVRLVGASGGGASGYTITTGDKNPVSTPYYGGDGGSGASAVKALTVTPGETLTVVVGAGGAGGVNVTPSTPAAGSAGTDSTVTQSAVVVARADAGSGAPSASDGAGGLASASVGDTTTDGVAGAGGAGGYGDTQDGTAGADGSVTITW